MSNSIYNTLWYTHTLYAAMTIFDMMHNCTNENTVWEMEQSIFFISSLFISNFR